MENRPFVSVIIPAAGEGKRMKTAQNKLLIPLDGTPLIGYSLKVFSESQWIKEVILVVSKENLSEFESYLKEKSNLNKVRLTQGGARRQDSVYNGLKQAAADSEIAMVHDGARPFVTEKMIVESIQAASQFGACVVGVRCKSTIKEADSKGLVIRTPNRESLWEIQTPQTAKKELLEKAFQKAEKEHLDVTDEGMLLEAMGEPVKIVEGTYTNIKVTTPDDLLLAEMILKKE